jgi:hypothetical protein
MDLYEVDPIRDPRWSAFLQRHQRASIFHTQGWLEALHQTYGYEPIAFTTSPPSGDIYNGLVFSHVNSWITGRRLVSSPFADHCEPLFDSVEELEFIIGSLQADVIRHKWKYIEIRPINGNFLGRGKEPGFYPAKRYYHHRIDLRPDLNQVRQGFDKDSILRRVRRAERAGFVEKCGRSEDLLKDFYNLHVLTRVRHSLPPQPYQWYTNLVECLNKALELRLAYLEGIPVAAILTLRFRDTVLYKYGCSDSRYKRFGGMPLLLLRAIEEAKRNTVLDFDLGRTDEDNSGLIEFKNHWTKHCAHIVYWRFPGSSYLKPREDWKLNVSKRFFTFIPKALLPAAGRLIYRHLG